jgi:DNA-binding winged helix-turn-helix (wHTH) protein/tetratricopeptide (TPR) repeat protein
VPFQSPYNFLSVPVPSQQRTEYGFGEFRLSCSILEFQDRLLPLSPKAIDTLYYLVSHAPEIVTKEEIISSVWPDTFVVESGLARNISLIRKALEENGGPGPYIETIPKRGYRFVAPVRVAPEAPPAVRAEASVPEAEGTGTDASARPLASPGIDRSRVPEHNHRTMWIRVGLATGAVIFVLLVWMTVQQFRPVKAQPPFDASARIGRHLLGKGSPEEVRRALDWFEAAVASEPGSAQAHAGLAESLIALTRLAAGTEQTIRRARAEAEVAVRLDPKSADAHAALGAARMCQLEFASAERAFRAALQLDPASVHARYYYAQLLSALLCSEEAIEVLSPAIAVDPVAPFLGVLMGRLYYSQRDFQTAARKFEEVLERERGDNLAHYYLALTLAHLGKFPEAGTHLDQARLHAGVLRTDRAWLMSRQGQPGLAQEVYGEIKAGVSAGKYSPAALLVLGAELGKVDDALQAIEAEENKSRFALFDIQADPRLESVRRDPRFAAIARRLFGPRSAF